MFLCGLGGGGMGGGSLFVHVSASGVVSKRVKHAVYPSQR